GAATAIERNVGGFVPELLMNSSHCSITIGRGGNSRLALCHESATRASLCGEPRERRTSVPKPCCASRDQLIANRQTAAGVRGGATACCASSPLRQRTVAAWESWRRAIRAKQPRYRT